METLYLRVLELCQTGLEFAGLVKAVINSRFCSAHFLRHLHEQAEKILHKPEDLLLLAESIALSCCDPAWSRRVYQKAVFSKDGCGIRSSQPR